jgi:hypothetical protein
VILPVCACLPFSPIPTGCYRWVCGTKATDRHFVLFLCATCSSNRPVADAIGFPFFLALSLPSPPPTQTPSYKASVDFLNQLDCAGRSITRSNYPSLSQNFMRWHTRHFLSLLPFSINILCCCADSGNAIVYSVNGRPQSMILHTYGREVLVAEGPRGDEMRTVPHHQSLALELPVTTGSLMHGTEVVSVPTHPLELYISTAMYISSRIVGVSTLKSHRRISGFFVRL